MIYRTLEEKLKQLLEFYPVVSVIGPRQSGKTTLIRNTLSHLPYVSLENPDNRALALDDPRLFLSNYPQGAVLDEVQRAPLLFSYIQGIVIENLIITELIKSAYHQGKTPQFYFWRDHRGTEVDLLIEKGQRLIPVEIKSGATKTMDYFKNLSYWNRLSGNEPDTSYVVYGGTETLNTKPGRLIGWQSFITDGRALLL